MGAEYVAGRFRLDRAIERGNMGEVHRAEDTHAPEGSPRRHLAVKLLLRRRSGAPVEFDDTSVRRFHREVEIMRRLEHPNIPHIVAGGIDTTQGDRLPYLAMELLYGHTVRDLSDEEHQLPVSWVAAIGAQVADALHVVHAKHVVHRDLKPANIMLTGGGRVVVLDFGMGRIVDDPDISSLTDTDATVGTARYMAPEQFAGAKVGPAADLYALGCVLYELLTGAPPFDGATPFELGTKHNNAEMAPIGLLRSDVPAKLTQLVEQLLRKDPERRPGSAAEVRDALRPLVEGEESVTGWRDFDPRNHVPHPAPAPLLDEHERPAHDAPCGVMDVFSLHKKLIGEYRHFTEGGTVIRDDRIADYVRADLDAKSQWPDPWLSLNPFFASGGTVADLVQDGLLHGETATIFQHGKKEGDTICRGEPLVLHRHQREAVETARTGNSYVLTTGTGSGKSLGYIVPIVDRVLHERAQSGGQAERRVRAIVVYPMNALANSQVSELRKFLEFGYGQGREPVTFARYTGQESEETREKIRKNPPDILLTNYVMLELMLTRPHERNSLIQMATGLDFLVFDELHSYRGRQGSDVALLARRVREACQAPRLQCVGTSATMVTEGTHQDQQEKVAEVAGTIFGSPVQPEHVITETVVRATADGPERVPAERITEQGAPRAYHELYQDPLARWIESTFGLTTDPQGHLVRQRPIQIEQAATQLQAETGVGYEQCHTAIRRTLEAGAECRHPVNDRPLFAFRLHQFLSKGDTVHTTLEPPETRELTRDYQLEVPSSGGKILLPLAFCRECGQEYLSVWRVNHSTGAAYQSRRDSTPPRDEAREGHLYISTDAPWPGSLAEVLDQRKLPEDWLEITDTGQERVIDSRRDNVPRPVTVDVHGTEGRGELPAAFVPGPFLFCLHCGVSYAHKRGRDFGKLATLGQEGRSSAASLISATIVRALKATPADALGAEARKLLTFVDNRQDASLQAGHFNDFVQVTQLRSGLYRALVAAGEHGLEAEGLAARVAEELGLSPQDYAKTADLPPRMENQAATAFRDVLTFQLYTDLGGGWRVTMPNLEQTGLLRIDYADLDWVSATERYWDGTHPLLLGAAPGQRATILRVLLDEMRRNLAIDTPYLGEKKFESIQNASENRLNESWQVESSDRPRFVAAYPTASTHRGKVNSNGLFFSGRHKFARYLNRVPFRDQGLNAEDLQHIVAQLLEVLAEAGLLTRITHDPWSKRRRFQRGETVTGYQVDAGCLIWTAGEGRLGAQDPLNRTYASGEGPAVNEFFQQLYRGAAVSLGGLWAREHTAQVDPREREKREQRFGDAELPLLYCSPTMELGVDIKDLNAVLMRNVPPTPANYAQRSGRGGRSGQPALITTYCATGNSHDQYYFRHSDRMVAGAVQAPRLELANEDLVAAHLHAIWLAETGVRLGRAIPEVIDITYDETLSRPDPTLELHDDVREKIANHDAQRRALAAAREVLATELAALAEMPWWDDAWLERIMRGAPAAFDAAFDRWRQLFRAALVDQAEQNRRVLDHSLSERDRKRAQSRRREAETQITLLKNESQDSKSVLSDFTPYRYLASEGFLPGYSFPRLPLAAYIPTRAQFDHDGDFLQRPRFLAIREFGPGALIYHEGARYQVTRVQLPPDSTGELTTGRACRCDHCGYHHKPEDNDDQCRLCEHPLGAATHNLLQLHTVYTTKREKISSDEEERRRAGFRLVTSFRFAEHSGGRPGRQDAEARTGRDSTERLARLSYGDSATVRRTNLGRLPAKRDTPDGFWLDPTTGKWLNEKQGQQATHDPDEQPLVEGGEAGADQAGHAKRVIPYVEDRRNILVLQLAAALPREQALSLMYALERGIEAAFELEDSELDSELLPPEEGPRDRILFTEATEGGAGVLRRLQHDNDALAIAARTALEICHITDQGEDRGLSDGTCSRGCYNCLLTFHNQLHHHDIDRRQIVPLLQRLAAAETLATGPGESRTEQMQRLTFASDTSLERQFVTWLKDRSYRLPDEEQVYLPAANARPDFVYRLPGAQVAVFVDGPVHQHDRVAERDAAAEQRLFDLGWLSIRFPYDADWGNIVAENTDFFGRGSEQ